MQVLPDILLTGPDVKPPTDSFVLHRAWELTQPELDGLAPKIRGITSSHRFPVNAAVFDRFPALEIVANFGVGYEHVDVPQARARGVMVTNTPDVLTDEVADLAMALLLSTVRRTPQAERYLRAGSWPSGPFPLSPTLRGRRVGILGLGRIGKAIAQRCQAFGLPVSYHGRRPQDCVAYPYFPDLTAMARDVDVLIVAATGGKETLHLVNDAVLEALGPQGILINIARGSLVDEPSLVRALRSGVILAAGLDVFASEPNLNPELLGLDNAVLLPHVGSASVATRQAMAQLAVENLLSWFHQGRALTPVPGL